MKKFILSAMAVLMAVAVYATGAKTVTFTLNPKLQCENCENKVKEALRYTDGVKDISTNVSENTVTVQFDSDKTNAGTLVKALAKVNYSATPAKTQAQTQGQKKCCGKACKNAGKGCCKRDSAKCGDQRPPMPMMEGDSAKCHGQRPPMPMMEGDSMKCHGQRPPMPMMEGDSMKCHGQRPPMPKDGQKPGNQD